MYLYDLQASRLERLAPGRVPSTGTTLASLETFAVSPTGGAGGGSEAVAAFAGDGGVVPLLSLRTRRWLGSVKVNGTVRAVSFSRDGSELITTGEVGARVGWGPEWGVGPTCGS